MSEGAKDAVDAGDTAHIDMTILGREYRIACPPAERDALLAAVAYLDGKMRDAAGKAKNAGNERIAVMVALNIAHELLTMKQPGGFDLASLRRRIDGMEAQLDAALQQQEKLF